MIDEAHHRGGDDSSPLLDESIAAGVAEASLHGHEKAAPEYEVVRHL